MHTTAMRAAVLMAVLTGCGSTSTGGGQGGAEVTGDGGVGGGGGTSGAPGGSGGASGTAGVGGGAPTIVEQCKAQACAGQPACAGCGEFCESHCTAEDGCGGPGCGADYVAACFSGQTCEAISSQNTLVKDATVYGCLAGVPSNDVCSFGGDSAATCQVCMYDKCVAPLKACDADTECHAWLECITLQSCASSGADQHTPDCYRACDDAHPGAAALFKAIYACTCANCPVCNVHQGACSVP